MDDWADLAYAVVDVEGNDQQPDLVELAVVPVTGGVIGEPTSWLVRPARPRQGDRSHDVDFESVPVSASCQLV